MLRLAIIDLLCCVPLVKDDPGYAGRLPDIQWGIAPIFEKSLAALNLIKSSKFLHFFDFMKLTPKFKIFGHWGSVGMLMLILGLGANNTAQAWPSQAGQGGSKQQTSKTVQIQENHAVIITSSTHFVRFNHARVALPFPPCYSVDYRQQPCCYGDQPGQGSVAIGVHFFGN